MSTPVTLRSPARDIREAIDEAIRTLTAIRDVADMQFARSDREMKEESSAFVAYVFELARPLDDMFRQIFRIGADNIGGLSPIEQKELDRSAMISDVVGDNWTPYFELAAIGAECEPDFYQKRYVRSLHQRGV